MNDRSIDALIAAIALALLAATALRWTRAVPTDATSSGGIMALAGLPRDFDIDALLRDGDIAVARNAFRMSRLPSAVRYSLDPGETRQTAPAHQLPTLVLRGIVGGPPWQAIIDGIPDRPSGTVVRGGNVFGNLEIHSVSRDTVVVRTADSTWRLTLSRDP